MKDRFKLRPATAARFRGADDVVGHRGGFNVSWPSEANMKAFKPEKSEVPHFGRSVWVATLQEAIDLVDETKATRLELMPRHFNIAHAVRRPFEMIGDISFDDDMKFTYMAMDG